MKQDEPLNGSPADDAAPSGNPESHASEPAADEKKPRRRASATPRTRRTKKLAEPEAAVGVTAEPAPVEIAVAPPEPESEPTVAPPADEIAAVAPGGDAAAITEPTPEPVSPVEAPPAKPRRRSTTSRKKATAKTPVNADATEPSEPATPDPTADIGQPAVHEVEAPITEPALGEAETGSVEPTAEAEPEALAAVEAEPEATDVAGEDAPEEPVLESPVVDSVADDAVAAEVGGTVDETVAPKPSRRRSRSRIKKEVPEISLLPEGEGAAEEASAVAEGDAPAEGAAAPEASAEPEVASASEAAPEGGKERRSRGRGRRSGRSARGEKAVGDAPVVEADAPLARVVVRNGFPELQINGRAVPPVMFFGDVTGSHTAHHVASEIRRAAKAGVHLYSTLIEVTCPPPPDDTIYETLDGAIDAILSADPHGYVMPRLMFAPAAGWRAQYPNEVSEYRTGKTEDPSFASEHYWMEVEQTIRQIIDHVRRMSYSDRVVGYHLERGEWFHSKDGGHERSFANREGFRRWLRAKYGNSDVALRAAWFDGQVQYYTADVPPDVVSPRPAELFLEPRKERRWIDFNEFTSDCVADRLKSLARVVKDASEGQCLVSVCYGYTFEHEHPASGHLSLARLLESPDIDLVTGPPSYRDRKPGGAGFLPCPVDSVHLHGKLWISEDDTRTHLGSHVDSSQSDNPRLENKTATEQVQMRSAGTSLGYQSGVAWMDLWGEGWLDADDIWQRIGSYFQHYAQQMATRTRKTSDIVVLVDERSLLYLQRGATAFDRILSAQRDAFLHCGASVAFHLQSDVLHDAFPTDARMYVFLNPARLPASERDAIRTKLHGGGRTLVWLQTVGICDDRGRPEESAHETTGFSLRQQSWNSEAGSRITETRHRITERLRESHIGQRERIDPTFYVDEVGPGTTILGEYAQSGLPSIAVRTMADWNSVFIGELPLPVSLIRGLARFSGVHLYTTNADDYLFAGNGWVTIHHTRDGRRDVWLPRGLSGYDLTAGMPFESGREYRVMAKANTTRLIRVGPREALEQADFNMTPPARQTEPRKDEVSEDLVAVVQGSDQLVAVPDLGDGSRLVPVVTEEAMAAAAALEAELAAEALWQDAAGDDEPIDDQAGEVGEDGSEGDGSASPRRRRRRRGGRGRGKRGGGSEAQAAGGGPD